MAGKVFIRFFALLCVLAAVLGIVYVLRDSVVRALAPRILADQDMVLTRFEGLHFNTRQLTVSDIELELASGQQLLLRELALAYHFESLLQAPQLESVELASAQLLPAAQASGETPTEAPAAETSLLLSDLLQLLREFPLARAAVADLRIPQSSKPLTLQLQGSAGDLDIRTGNGELLLDAHFSQANAAAPASLQATLTRDAARLGNFELTLQPVSSTYMLNGAGHLAIADLNALLDALEQAPLPFRSVDMGWDVAGSVADDIRGTLASAASAPADGSAPRFVIGIQSGSHVVLPPGMASGLGELSLTFTDRVELNVITGLQPLITGVLPLQVRGDWQQQALSVDAQLALSACGLAQGAPCSLAFDGKAGVGTYTLAGKINATIDGSSDIDDAVSRYHLRTETLTLGGLTTWLPPFDIDATLALEGQTLSFSTPLLLRGAPADAGISINGHYDLDTGIAAARVNLASLEFAEGRALSNYVSGWPYAIDLLAGSLSADMDLQWLPDDKGGKLTGNISALLQDLAGSHEDIFFRGLNGQLSGTIDTSAAMPLDTPALALTIAGVDIGLPLDNITMDFRVEREGQRLLVDSLSAQVLDGTVGGSNLDYGFNRERNELTLRFDGLRLERMLELAEYDGVTATGAVSGEVPLTITADSVSVTAGTLHADAPGGTIRYVAGAAGTTGNAGLDLVNQALGNYQFDSLISDINYTPEGELLFGMKMQGHNPDMNGGQRINLNLNLSDNVPALLQSLQAARAIEDFLQDQYSPPQQ